MSDTAEVPSQSPILPTTVAVPPTPTLATKVMEWSRPVIAVFSLTIFAMAFWIAWKTEDKTSFNTLVGATVTLVSTIAGYYFGSSAGSQKKDDTIKEALKIAQGMP